MSTFEIREDDLSGEQTRALLEYHLGGMRDDSPPGYSFALDLTGLKSSDVTVWSAWDGAILAGVGALKQLNRLHGEIKSMRTAPTHLRRGVGAAILEHIIGVARLRGMNGLSLETGTGQAFEAALSMYRKRGFKKGPAFANYVGSEFNQFLHLDLGA